MSTRGGGGEGGHRLTPKSQQNAKRNGKNTQVSMGKIWKAPHAAGRTKPLQNRTKPSPSRASAARSQQPPPAYFPGAQHLRRRRQEEESRLPQRGRCPSRRRHKIGRCNRIRQARAGCDDAVEGSAWPPAKGFFLYDCSDYRARLQRWL